MGEHRVQGHGRAIGGTGTVLSLMGAQTSINGRERTDGFRELHEEDFPNITLIEEPTDWDARRSRPPAIQTILAANSDLAGAFYMQSRLRALGERSTR